MAGVAPTPPGGKIIFVTHEYAPFRGGVATYVAELAAAIGQSGSEVEVWAPDYGKCDFKDGNAFKVIRLRSGGSLSPLHQLQLMRELFKRRKQLAQNKIVLGSVGAHLAWMILEAFGLIGSEQLVSLLHGSEVLRFKKNPLWRKLANRFYAKHKKAVTVSNFSKSLIEKNFPKIKDIAIAGCACTTAAMKSVHVSRPADKKVRILTLARIHPRKGQLDVAQALGALPEEFRQMVIYQLGGKGDSEYLEQVQATCAQHDVTLEILGEIGPDQLAATYIGCDIFAMTSRSLPNSVEGFGIAYLDAAYHGKPILAYATGGAKEAVQHFRTGIFVEEGDIVGLTKMFIRLINNSAMRERLGAEGRRWARQHSWQQSAGIFQRC